MAVKNETTEKVLPAVPDIIPPKPGDLPVLSKKDYVRV